MQGLHEKKTLFGSKKVWFECVLVTNWLENPSPDLKDTYHKTGVTDTAISWELPETLGHDEHNGLWQLVSLCSVLSTNQSIYLSKPLEAK